MGPAPAPKQHATRPGVIFGLAVQERHTVLETIHTSLIMFAVRAKQTAPSSLFKHLTVRIPPGRCMSTMGIFVVKRDNTAFGLHIPQTTTAVRTSTPTIQISRS